MPLWQFRQIFVCKLSQTNLNFWYQQLQNLNYKCNLDISTFKVDISKVPFFLIFHLLVCTSVCSRDSRPRDCSRLGAIFMVSVSPNISRDSRDCGQPFISLFYPLSKPYFLSSGLHIQSRIHISALLTMVFCYQNNSGIL